ncbi:MAG TPA: hypothetical protein DCE00_02675 [Firmicutes bacterium]|nr:hypothetical protein [Bacillota bacterium]
MPLLSLICLDQLSFPIYIILLMFMNLSNIIVITMSGNFDIFQEKGVDIDIGKKLLYDLTSF